MVSSSTPLISDQPVCKLCLERLATQTGSHILPFSLIREAISYQGSNKRNKEILFTFSTEVAPIAYIGRGVLPEQEQEAREDFPNIESQISNPTTEDNIFCPECESRFSSIEGYFSDRVINQLADNEILFSDNNRLFNVDNVNDDLVRLYTYGLFWRCSISRIHSSFKLEGNEQESIRIFLNKYMNVEINRSAQKLSTCTDLLITLPLTIVFSQKLEDPTNAIIHCHPSANKPYLIIANRFSFLLYLKESHTRSTPSTLYGFNSYYRLPKVINTSRYRFVFVKIKREEYELIIRNVIEAALDGYINKVLLNFKIVGDGLIMLNAEEILINE